MTETELSTEIKTSSLCGIYFFYGDEDYMKNHRTAEIRSSITAAYPDFAEFNSIELYFGDGELDYNAVSAALDTPPLLAPQKVVVIAFSSLDSLKEKERSSLLELLENFSNSDDGSTVVVLKVSADGFDAGQPKKPSAFLAKAQKFMKCVTFDYQSDSRLSRWIERHFAEYGLTAHPAVIGAILSMCGKSMYRLSGEISKTAAYTAQSGRHEVTFDDVNACVTRTDEDDAFRLANCVLEGNTSAALDELGVKIRKREEPIILLSQITRVFSDLCCASAFITDGREKSEYAKEMRMHDYKASLYYRAAKMKEPEFFMKASLLCTDADRKMKLGGGYGVLEELICSLAEQ